MSEIRSYEVRLIASPARRAGTDWNLFVDGEPVLPVVFTTAVDASPAYALRRLLALVGQMD